MTLPNSSVRRYSGIYTLRKGGGGSRSNEDYLCLKNPLRQPYTYTGREYDEETGLYYYRARYYSPSIGRFLQEDPAGEENLYAYVGNSPTNYIDPSGEIAWLPIVGLALWFVLMNPDTANAPDLCQETYESTGMRDMAIDAGTMLATGAAFAGAKYLWGMRPYWTYYTRGTQTTSKWMTRSWGWWKPYKFGHPARKALNLPRWNEATAVKRISAKSLRHVMGPRHPKPQPRWKWYTEGRGWEYYADKYFPAN